MSGSKKNKNNKMKKSKSFQNKSFTDMPNLTNDSGSIKQKKILFYNEIKTKPSL